MTWFGNSDEIPMIHRENPRMGKLTFQDRLTLNRGIMDGPNGPIEDMMLGEYTEEDRSRDIDNNFSEMSGHFIAWGFGLAGLLVINHKLNKIARRR